MNEEFLSLRDHFAAIFDGSDKDPLEHIVILSYEFDDQQVLNLVTQRPLNELFEPRVLHLAQVAETVPVVIYDARKTREHNRLPHFMDLLAVRKPAWTCHHSKAYLIVTRKRIHLALGSMNLTASGLFSNREVFESFTWSEDDVEDLEVIQEFCRIVRKGYASFDSVHLVRALDVIERRLANFRQPSLAGGAALIHQGYDDVSGLDLLAQRWRQHFGDAVPDHVIAVSPFFDQDVSKRTFAGQLLSAFPSLAKLDIITDEAARPGMCGRHFGGVAERHLFLIPQEIQPGERARIAKANEGVDITELAIVRKLHAKILILARGERSLVYLGSANFTRKAWDGANHEMGVARPHRVGASTLLTAILRNLSAQQVDRYKGLPEMPPAVVSNPDEEDYQELKGYPDFIQGIELIESTSMDMLNFVVKAEADKFSDLLDYVITWGSIEIHFEGAMSQTIASDRLLSCLLGGRNLKFTCRSDSQISYFLPFRHAPELFAQRERYVYPSAEDWMFRYLGVESPGWRDINEYLPGDPVRVDEDDPAALMRTTRNANPVIRMQQYLSLFSRIQSEFGHRVKALEGLPAAEQDSAWDSQVGGPLATFADVLTRQRKHAGLDQETIFKLGELVLFTRAITSARPERLDLFSGLLAKLPSRSDDPVVNEYLRLCHLEA